MAIPVIPRSHYGGSRQCLAVIQMINKMEFDGNVAKFDDEDVQVMETFATFVAAKLESNHFLRGISNSRNSCTSIPAPEAAAAFADERAGDRFSTQRRSSRDGERLSARRGSAMSLSLAEIDEEQEDKNVPAASRCS